MDRIKRFRNRPWIVHAIADCSDCGWEETDYKTAVQKGRRHAETTGHTVSVETGYAQIHNPK